MSETIFARATAPGRAGISVVRVSGPRALDAAAALAGDLPGSHRAGLRRIVDASGQVLDHGLVLTFPAGHSFTGEDVVELHLHGSPAIVAAVLAALDRMDGLRPAEAGEFTRRALENQRMDLAQVEGLADLIEAETEWQRQQAFAVFDGKLSEQTERWRAALIRAAALVEATIDFADEDVPVDVFPEVRHLLAAVGAELQHEAAGVATAERAREGFQAAIVGRPNSGKSTLLNAIAGRDVAITSEIAGTTRDVIEVHTDLAGVPVTFLDTAGLRESEDRIEALGVERARKRAAAADIRIFLLDGDDTISGGVEPQSHDIRVYAKGDLPNVPAPSVSGLTGAGLVELLDRIEAELAQRLAVVGTATRLRHQRALEAALEALGRAESELDHGPGRTELAAEAILAAIRGLDQLIGRVDVENVLDHIFSSFCIGK